MSKAAPWDTVKLRVAFGDVPPSGVELRTPSGRRYLVDRVGGKTLHCIVLPADYPQEFTVLDWYWSPRAKKRRMFR